jgi:hypothetical protein
VVKNEGSGVIIRFLTSNKSNLRRISDYNLIKNQKKEAMNSINFPIEFMMLDPGKQIINTFHQTVYEDMINWYPEPKPYKIPMYIPIYDENTVYLGNLTTTFNFDPIYADNIIRRVKFKKGKHNVTSFHRAFLSTLKPTTYVIGEFVKSCLKGVVFSINPKLTIWDPTIPVEQQDEYAMYIYNSYGKALINNYGFKTDIDQGGHFLYKKSGKTEKNIIGKDGQYPIVSYVLPDMNVDFRLLTSRFCVKTWAFYINDPAKIEYLFKTYKLSHDLHYVYKYNINVKFSNAPSLEDAIKENETQFIYNNGNFYASREEITSFILGTNKNNFSKQIVILNYPAYDNYIPVPI